MPYLGDSDSGCPGGCIRVSAQVSGTRWPEGGRCAPPWVWQEAVLRTWPLHGLLEWLTTRLLASSGARAEEGAGERKLGAFQDLTVNPRATTSSLRSAHA